MPKDPVKFLLVDDVEENLLALDGLLRREGLELLQARSGREALELLLVHDIALAIVDVQMPGMDGFELAELMRGAERTRLVPIIFVTAGAVDSQRRFRGYESGAVDFLFKPIEPHVLRSKAEIFFHLYRQRQELAFQRDELRASETQLEAANAHLQAEINARTKAEETVRNMNAELEQRIQARTAALAATNRELEAFCYSVSHDLRTPLRSIDGFSQALLEDCGPQLNVTGRGHLQRVRANCQRMGRLIDDLLNLSRLTRVHMRRTAVDLTDLAESAVAELRKADPSRAVDVCIAPGLAAKGDPTLLGTVMVNLLENAWKFTSQRPDALIEMGRVSLVTGHSSLGESQGTDSQAPMTVPVPPMTNDPIPMTNDAAQPPPTNDQTVFFVRDNGVGFDMRYADKLFTPFQRLHAMDDYPGSGIGLATVQRVIHRHGGRVWFESAPGKGATFYFTVGANV